mgnify:FL=1
MYYKTKPPTRKGEGLTKIASFYSAFFFVVRLRGLAGAFLTSFGATGLASLASAFGFSTLLIADLLLI